jgi:hypothetical protein
MYKLENCSIFVQALFISCGPETLAKLTKLYCSFYMYSNFSMMMQEKYDVSEERALKLKTINSLERYFYLGRYTSSCTVAAQTIF